MSQFLKKENIEIIGKSEVSKEKSLSPSKSISSDIIESKYNKGKWTFEEDETLKKLVLLYGEKSWKKISYNMKKRSSIQCLHRWTKILKPGLVKGPWTLKEDEILLNWVKKEGFYFFLFNIS